MSKYLKKSLKSIKTLLNTNIQDHLELKLAYHLKKYYIEYKIIEEKILEEGIYCLIMNYDNFKIIGIVSENNESMYDIDSTYEIKDFTDDKKINEMFEEDIKNINEKPVIVCDEQGGILVLNNGGNDGFFTKVIPIEVRTKENLETNYNIDQDSFILCAKDGNSTYKKLTNNEAIINFLMNLHNDEDEEEE